MAEPIPVPQPSPGPSAQEREEGRAQEFRSVWAGSIKASPEDFAKPNFYEITYPGEGGKYERRNLALAAADPEWSKTDPKRFRRIRDRAYMTWKSLGEAGIGGHDDIGGRFLFDLAASDMDDDTILKLAHARRRFLQDRSVFGHIRSIAGEPFQWLEWGLGVPQRGLDSLAKKATGDPGATVGDLLFMQLRDAAFTKAQFGGMSALGVAPSEPLMGSAYSAARQNGVPMNEFLDSWHAEHGGVWDSVFRFGLRFATDPLTWAGGLLQLGKAGKVVRAAGEAVPTGAGVGAQALGARTAVADIPKYLRWGTETGRTVSIGEAYRTGQIGDWLRVSLGKNSGNRKLIERIAESRGAGEIQGILRNEPAEVSSYLWRSIQKARTASVADRLTASQTHARIVDTLIDDLSAVFDPRKSEQIAKMIRQVKAEASFVDNENRILSLVESTAGKRPSLGSALAEQAYLRGEVSSAEYVTTKAQALKTVLADLRLQLGPMGSMRSIPRARMSRGMRDWAERNLVDAYDDYADVHWMRSSANAAGARTIQEIEKLSFMSPHSSIRIEDPRWPEQIRRIGQEYEVQVPGWTRAQTDDLVTQALNQTDELALEGFVHAAQREAFRAVGVTDSEWKRITAHYNTAREEIFGKHVYGIHKGREVTTPILSSQTFDTVALMDMRLFRAVARQKRLLAKGGVKGATGQALKALDDAQITEVVEALNATWRGLASLKPAYIVRVVMSSEVLRNTLAGHASPLNHPLTWLTASFPESKVAKGIHKIYEALDLPGPSGYGDMAQFAKDVGEVALPGGGLGTQMAPDRLIRHRAVAKITGAGSTTWEGLAGNPIAQEAYKRAWVRHLNEQWAVDPVVNAFWRPGAPMQDAVNWLKGPGWEYAQKMELNPGALGFDKRARDFLKKQREVFEEITGGDSEIIARMGKLRYSDVEDVAAPARLPISVAERGLSGPSMVKTAQFVEESILGKMWSVPAWVSRQFARNGPYRHELAREVIRQASLAEGVSDVSIKRIIDAAKRIGTATEGKGLNEIEYQILRNARNHAEYAVKQTVYDLAESARVTDLARFIMPFGNAWQEELTRWMRFSFERPGTAAVMGHLAKEALQSDVLTWRDPDSSRPYFLVPLGDRITQFATGTGWNPFTRARSGLRVPLKMGYDNAFVLTAGNDIMPGLGPMVQIPAEVVANAVPEWRDAMSFLLPYSSSEVTEQLLPSAFLREYRNATEEELTTRYARKAAEVIGYHLAKGERPSDDMVKSQVSALFKLDAFLGASIGGGLKSSLPPKVLEMVSFYRYMSKEVPEVADFALLERYGEALAAWTVSLTSSSAGTPPATKEARDLLVSPRMSKLADTYGDVFWSAFAELLPGATHDPVAFARQIKSGQRSVRNVGGLYEAAMLRVSWAEYNRVRSAAEKLLSDQGITPGSKIGKLVLERVREYRKSVLEAHNPAFAKDFQRFSERQYRRKENIQSLAQIIAEPEMPQGSTRTFLTQYFQARAVVRAAMQRNEWAGLDRSDARVLNEAWTNTRQRLVAAFPAAVPLYERFLAYDPMDFDIEVK